MVSQKCQYALRAVFELSKHFGKGPVKIAEIAEEQAIPVRFLEVILSQLKQGGFVESRRGRDGGYLLSRSPDRLAVGDVIRFVEGPIGPVSCVAGNPTDTCPLHGGCVFLSMWERAREAVTEVYDRTTFEDLVDEERRSGRYVPSYTI
jgi:Rrf2 family protein